MHLEDASDGTYIKKFINMKHQDNCTNDETSAVW